VAAAAEPAGPTSAPAVEPAAPAPPATPGPNQGKRDFLAPFTRKFVRRLELRSHQLEGLVEDVVENPEPVATPNHQVECKGGWGNLALPEPSPVLPQEAVQPHIVADPSI
jgi:hypothetical protein